MTLEGREALEAYLEHPLHLGFVRQVQAHVEQRLTFDQGEERPAPGV